MPRPAVYVITAVSIAAVAGLAAPSFAGSDDAKATAKLQLADGSDVGKVGFETDDGVTTVDVKLDLPDDATTSPAFHGLHVHANDDPANGEGCKADPDQPTSTWFTAVDGHLKSGDEAHGYHLGDLPPIQLDDSGRGQAEFDADRLKLDDLDGRAVVLHADPDNFDNVPVGTGPDQYTANSPAASDKTAGTGNSGDRVACGVIATG